MTTRIGEGHWVLPDNREVKFQPVSGEPLTWEQVDYFVDLTEEEKAKAKLLKCDCKKVRIVKSFLARGIKSLEIHKKTGISRTSIDKYKKIVSGNYHEIQGNYHQTTVLSESVVSILLLFNALGVQTTMPLILVLMPLLVLMIGAYVKRKWERYKQEQLAHKAEAAKLRNLVHIVGDFSFHRYPLMCNSEAEEAHYNALLKHYNNVGRSVIVVELKEGRSSMQHFMLKEQASKTYCINNRYEIKEGTENFKKWKKELERLDLLDFLRTPKKKNWLMSKAYLHSLVDFYVHNSIPAAKDRSRKKFAYESMPDVDEYVPEMGEWEVL